ncbi:MAG TPA: thioesterase family protein [Candidatus Coprenecus avistercoris]|uniref:Thioesterase family protein n=1 Tax=Candidatus Coprenecus avistercoris TaxID=2840730 RepID=A0A9D1E1N9_9BACT|nr:thioesterase family protein [Candidatus Coprenecus avistercoris]
MATEDIKVGISATSTTKVCKENCASLMGSGELDVFATPAVVAYMEMAACYAVNGLLEEGLSTVGTRIDIAHIKASPIGETITATATLKEIDGRRLVFDVTARDSKGEIANGTHERFIIKVDKFLAKIQ